MIQLLRGWTGNKEVVNDRGGIALQLTEGDYSSIKTGFAKWEAQKRLEKKAAAEAPRRAPGNEVDEAEKAAEEWAKQQATEPGPGDEDAPF